MFMTSKDLERLSQDDLLKLQRDYYEKWENYRRLALVPQNQAYYSKKILECNHCLALINGFISRA